jgi:hypothetical protein
VLQFFLGNGTPVVPLEGTDIQLPTMRLLWNFPALPKIKQTTALSCIIEIFPGGVAGLNALFRLNDNYIIVKELKDVDGEPVNDAILTYELIDPAGGDVLGAEAFPMPYSGTPGEYRGLVASLLNLTTGGDYVAVIRASNYGFERRRDVTIMEGQ